jgi:DNA polymerase III delta prime subunit
MSRQLITKHRPSTFAEVVGNAALIQSLAAAVRGQDRPHGYLFTGIAGVGKTTLARIIAKEINASVIEIDAASDSGVGTARGIVRMSQFAPVTSEPNRLFMIDEAHALSKPAFNPFLKLIEDSPDSNYVAFCTTDPTNIPDTIRSRCFCVDLMPLTATEIRDYIADIAKREGWIIPNSVLMSIVQAAKGSPRMALSILQVQQRKESISKGGDKKMPRPINPELTGPGTCRSCGRWVADRPAKGLCRSCYDRQYRINDPLARAGVQQKQIDRAPAKLIRVQSLMKELMDDQIVDPLERIIVHKICQGSLDRLAERTASDIEQQEAMSKVEVASQNLQPDSDEVEVDLRNIQPNPNQVEVEETPNSTLT